jgi:hypothetical protein
LSSAKRWVYEKMKKAFKRAKSPRKAQGAVEIRNKDFYSNLRQKKGENKKLSTKFLKSQKRFLKTGCNRFLFFYKYDIMGKQNDFPFFII